jgi:L-alanine-DL-glutamate epimerase-like enolase superfamily enzyme
MKVTGVTCHVLLDPGFDRGATSSNQDDIVVEVHTDEGITGIGETDLNAWVARACIEASSSPAGARVADGRLDSVCRRTTVVQIVNRFRLRIP